VDVLGDDEKCRAHIDAAAGDFALQNAKREKRNDIPLPDGDLDAIRKILDVHPLHTGIIDALDNWVAETQKDAGRLPNENEWQRLRDGPLDGKIGISFALQWRYNFGRLFGELQTAP
jgi:hypothetical protein